MAKTTTKFGLYITVDRDRSYGDYFHVRATPVTIGLTAYERNAIDAGENYSARIGASTIRNCSASAIEDNGLHLNNLHVNSQGNGNDQTRHLYGFDVDYRNVFSIDRAAAERMAKTLKTIEARMEKATEKYGRPSTFGAYVARVADAIGATAIVYNADPTQRGWSYDDSDNRILSIAGGVMHIDGIARAWQRETEPKAMQVSA